MLERGLPVWPALAQRWLRTRSGVCALALLFSFVLFVRRYAQLLHPAVWEEDAEILADFIHHGPLAVFFPLNGYLVIVTRLIALVAVLFPLPLFPLVGTLLAWIFMVLVAIAIALAPMTLRGGPLLAFGVLLVPSTAEVFGVPLYTLWWAPLLVFIVAFWDPERPALWMRIAFTLIGGFAAPVIVLIAPIMVLRALHYRKRSESILMLLSLACAAVQLILIVKLAPKSVHSPGVLIGSIVHELPRFLGSYAVGNIFFTPGYARGIAMIAAICTVAVVVGIAYARNAALRQDLALLSYLWLGTVALACSRISPLVADPVYAGPRYFFYPFVLESWILIQIALHARQPALRTISGVTLVVALFNVAPVLSHAQDDLMWRSNLARCETVPGNTIAIVPIEFAGSALLVDNLRLTGSECRTLDRFGLTGLAFESRHPGPSSIATNASGPTEEQRRKHIAVVLTF